MSLTLLSTLADVAPSSAQVAEPCGPVADASSLCLSVYRTTGNAVLADLSDTLVVRPAKIALVLAVAYVARRLLLRLLGGS